MPSISAEDAPKLKPYMKLAEQIGSLAGQITQDAMEGIEIEYEGSVSEINTKPLTALIVAHLLKPQLESVNMVNAIHIAEDRGIEISETRTGSSRDFRSLISVSVKTKERTHHVAGTLFTGKEPRIVNIDGVPVEAALAPHMLYIRNEDKPGLIGGVGMILAEAQQNIADFRLGRVKGGGSDKVRAVALISLENEIPEDVFEKLKTLPQIRQIKRLTFA